MKKWLIPLLALLLCAANALAEAPQALSLMPGIHLTWDDTPETIEAKLGDSLRVSNEGTRIAFYEYDGLTFITDFAFEEGRLSKVTMHTDGLGDSTRYNSCAASYDALLKTVTEMAGPDAVVSVRDRWYNTKEQSRNAQDDLSYAMRMGWLCREAAVDSEFASYVVFFSRVDNKLQLSVAAEPPKPCTGIWMEKMYDNGDGSCIVTGTGMGTSRDAGHSNETLAASVEFHAYSNTHELYARIVLAENAVTTEYTNMTTEREYIVTLHDCDGTAHTFSGTLQARSRVIFVDRNVEEMAEVFRKGGRVTVSLTAPLFRDTLHTFVLEDVSGFSAAFDPWREQITDFNGWVLLNYPESVQSFIASPLMSGTFTRGSYSDAPLSVFITCHPSNGNVIFLELYENGRDQVIADSLFNITVTDESGTRLRILGFMSRGMPGIDCSNEQLLQLMRQGGSLQFLIEQDVHPGQDPNYSFVLDADGFAAIFEACK